MQSIVDSTPNKEEVHEVFHLNQSVSIEVGARLVGACAVVDIGESIKIDGFLVDAAREETKATVLVRICVVVQGCTVNAPFSTTTIVSLTWGHGGQELFICECGRLTCLHNPRLHAPYRPGGVISQQEGQQIRQLNHAISVEVSIDRGIGAVVFSFEIGNRVVVGIILVHAPLEQARAIVEQSIFLVVHGCGINAAAASFEETRIIFISGIWVVVACATIGTTGNFIGITDPVSIFISQTVAVTIKSLFWEGASAVVNGCGVVIVACFSIRAARTREEVTAAIVDFCFWIEVASSFFSTTEHHARREVTGAIVNGSTWVVVASTFNGTSQAVVRASAIVVGGAFCVVAGFAVCAAKHLKFITYTVAVVIVQALSFAVVGEFCIDTRSIFEGRFLVVVAR